MKLLNISKALMILLWLGTLAVALCWLFWKAAPFDPEPITVVLGLVSTAVTALLNEFQSRLEEEEFSLSYALAYGYVNNFVEPLLTQLIKDSSPSGEKPKLFIYMPEKLSELSSRNIDRVIGELRMKQFQDSLVNLEFKEGRARDVLTVTSATQGRAYFDFPNTLLSLNSLIDYKLESRKNKFTDSARDEMAHDYIVKFKSVVEKLIDAKDLKPYVSFVDKNLEMSF
jgi:hypothetical protein